ncbi:MAG: ammonia-forming cytochrome c nitrite reductase subunit c552 [Phycisphaeraceae bacterium]|nr:MAG: ammonia-forming cytochrome c nitrite reductase subunit c552 [Phycisphaeraceae bacterium]
MNDSSSQRQGGQPSSRRISLLLLGVLAAAAGGTAIVTYTLVQMFEHKQDARSPYLRIVDLNETSTDPVPWGMNWPHHFEQYKQTAGDRFYGGSSAMPQSKLDSSPWLKRLYAGYAFSIDYREARGHAYMLYDQVVTERVNQRAQAGACLHCHASTTVLYRKAGLEALGMPADHSALASAFDMPAVIKGFEALSTKPYHEVLEMLTQVPDGTGADGKPIFDSPPVGGFTPGKVPEGHFAMGEAHPVSCIDCHDPSTMKVRITRPGFMLGMQALAESSEPLPHMPSVEKWRKGDRALPYDPNTLATRQEMRSFACGQCHVEYYCATKDTLTFPWGNGLKAEQIESIWEAKKFPDGSKFMDYKHAETGAPLFKAQHPEFELWSQGIHARSGVSCADCHMPYERVGAMKLSSHNVRSPMENIDNACRTCHHVPAEELRARVEMIQDRTVHLMERTAHAMTEMLDAIMEAKASGVSEEALGPVYELQRKAMWRLDYISSENSKGFHADQEAARILGESIDFSRQAQAMALRLLSREGAGHEPPTS